MSDSKSTSPPAAPRPSRLLPAAIVGFSALRIGFGTSLIIYPGAGLSLLRIPASGDSGVLARVIGVRDIALGALLLNARPSTSDEDPRSRTAELRRGLLANIIAEAGAVSVFLACFIGGDMPWEAFRVAVFGTAGVVCLEMLILQRLRS